jgi:hypothetical protein
MKCVNKHIVKELPLGSRCYELGLLDVRRSVRIATVNSRVVRDLYNAIVEPYATDYFRKSPHKPKRKSCKDST